MENDGFCSFSEEAWRKSTWSANNGCCVEVNTALEDVVGVRDTKEDGDPNRTMLVFNRPDFQNFVDFVVAEATTTA